MCAQNTNIEGKLKLAIAANKTSVTELDEGVSGACVKMGENMNDIGNRLAMTQTILKAYINSNAGLFQRADAIVKKSQTVKPFGC